LVKEQTQNKNNNNFSELLTLDISHPNLVKQWHPNKNTPLIPKMFKEKSSKRIFWICDKGSDHVWEATIYNRTRPNRTGCPFCANKKIVLANCLATTHAEIAKQWHPTKNKFTPLDVVGGSNKKVWWKCDKGDDHVWEAIICSRTKSNGSGCPFCPRKISSSNSLATTHAEIAKEWHPTKNKFTPLEMCGGSHKKAWWICNKDDKHVWETRIANRTRPNGSGGYGSKPHHSAIKLFKNMLI